MQSKSILVVAVASAFAAPAAAMTYDENAFRTIHADFQTQLEEAAALPAETGSAARNAAVLMAAQNNAQERLVLPCLTDAGQTPAAKALHAEMPTLLEGDIALVTALVELYGAAETAGQPDTARMAERMIWHETSDIHMLYPAALRVGAMADAD